MLYVLTGKESPNGLALRARVRPEHLERARRLVEQGRMMIAGPCPAVDAADPGPAGYSGSVIIAEFPSLADARAWMAADPYVTAGVFASWDVRPFVRVLP